MATRVVEGKKPYTGGEAISIDENKVISLNLRDENNLIIYDSGDDEIYVDLQLPDGIQPTDAFPVGVTTGRVLVADDWDITGTIICAKTTSGDNIKLLYGDNGTLWIDNGTGTFKQIYFKADVDALLLALRNYIDGELAKKQNGVSSITAPTNPSEGDLWYDTANDTMKVWNGTTWDSVGTGGGGGAEIEYKTQAEYNALLPGALTDNKHYFIYSTSGGGGWQPGVNTLAYRPLTDDANDHSGNSRNLTLNNCSLITFGGLKCLQFSSGYASTDIGTTFNHDWTVSLWHYNSIDTTEDMGFFSQGTTQADQCILVMDWGTNGKVYCFSNYNDNYNDTLSGPRVPVLSWEYLTVTYEYSTKTIKLFVGGDLKGTTILTNQYSLPNTTFLLGDILLKTNSEFSGYMSEVIVENKVRAAQEIADYYNQTKANYGIS